MAFKERGEFEFVCGALLKFHFLCQNDLGSLNKNLLMFFFSDRRFDESTWGDREVLPKTFICKYCFSFEADEICDCV